MLKKLKLNISALLIYLLIRILKLTQTTEHIYHPEAKKIFENHTPLIKTFWHNRQIMMPWAFLNTKTDGKHKLNVLISEHSDGRLVAKVISLVGMRNVKGSSSSRGRAALRELIGHLQDGHSVAITPDGPRGPIYKAKPGVISIAKKTGAPIAPVTLSADKYWQFNSWDKMILPKPFAKITYHFGEPIYIPAKIRGEEFQTALKDVEAALNNLTQSGDTSA